MIYVKKVKRSIQPVVTTPPVGPAYVLLHHDQIAARAYEYYVARDARGGSADADWHQAEAELRRQP